ncbi:sugar ABC transporter substrate-binding protein [Paractinoplanes tereljensis]
MIHIWTPSFGKVRLAIAGALAVTLLAGCSAADDSKSAGGSGVGVGVVLTDVTSSPRWKNQDPGYFRDAFRNAGVSAEVRHVAVDGSEFRDVGEALIKQGVKVLIITSPDSAAGKALIASAREAKVTVIDYDRLTVGGSADYVVGFDSAEIGRMQGYAMIKCLGTKSANPLVAELNGAPSDYNAAQLTAGHDIVLESRYADAEYTKGPSQYVPGWAPAQAKDIFTQMIGQQPRIDGVLAADDGIAAAAIGVLRGLGRNGKVPVTGQNATVEGLRNVLTGDQCMTVYKRIKLEAQTAANIAVQLLRGQKPPVSATINDPESNREIPFNGLVPLPITATEVKDVVADGFVEAGPLCAGNYQELCRKYGVIGT